MVHIGNHMKFDVPRRLRERSREFYGGLLGCKMLESPRPDLDLYEFAGGFVIGVFEVEDGEALGEGDCLKAAWLELKVEDPAAWKERLEGFGVRRVKYADASRFYFQAPGGQVFRLAPMDGGL